MRQIYYCIGTCLIHIYRKYFIQNTCGLRKHLNHIALSEQLLVAIVFK